MVNPHLGQDIAPPPVLTGELAHAIRGTAADVKAMLRPVTDTGRAVPGLEWTLGETAAHLAQANWFFAEVAAGQGLEHGDGTPGSIAEANAQALAAFPERRAEPLAEMIEEQAEAFIEAVSGRSPEERRRTPMGEMDLPTMGSYFLTHMLGHCFDIAGAVAEPHRVDRERVESALPFVVYAIPLIFDKDAADGLTARYSVSLWGGARLGVTVDGDRISAEPGPLERPDRVLVAEPATFLRIVLGRGDPTAAMERGLLEIQNPGQVQGVDSSLAARFGTLFRAP
ncbi:maleylpyruvate isomerase N-terminal domain-containing protein [Streptomyces sp. O3]